MILPDDNFWKAFKETPGAFSCAEALALVQISALTPDGIFAEFGTHKGKSTLASIYGRRPSAMLLNDLIFEDDNIVREVGVAIRKIDKFIALRFYECESVKLIPQYKYAYAFLDTGDHGEDLVQSEKVLLEDAIVSGGILAFHDLDNQFTAVRRCYDQLLATGKYEEIPINWNEIFEYVKEYNLEEGNNSWHVYADLPHPPNFVGALRRK
jgi:hypothetical protein